MFDQENMISIDVLQPAQCAKQRRMEKSLPYDNLDVTFEFEDIPDEISTYESPPMLCDNNDDDDDDVVSEMQSDTEDNVKMFVISYDI